MSVNDWLNERERIRAAATEGPWAKGEVINWGDENDVPQAPVLSRNRAITWDDHSGEVFRPDDAEAIVDAHNTLPKLTKALKAVLEVLDSAVRDGDSAELIRRVALQEIEEAIND